MTKCVCAGGFSERIIHTTIIYCKIDNFEGLHSGWAGEGENVKNMKTRPNIKAKLKNDITPEDIMKKLLGTSSKLTTSSTRRSRQFFQLISVAR